MPEAKQTVYTVTLNEEKPPLMVGETVYHNNPILNIVFTGKGYPSTLKVGVGKVRMILHALPELVAFYEKYKGNLSSAD